MNQSLNIDDVKFRKISSSIILEVAYHNNSLFVKFKDGSIYEYFDMPKLEYNNMLWAKSIWSYLKKNLASYKYKKHENNWRSK